jgi:N-acetyl-alpha-D-muramate 1-phosphate uridylyltransferase
MILAAGRGERMRPLTDATPKPLLSAGGKPLIQWQIERLVAEGIRDIVINHAWLGGHIEAALGDGSRFGASIRYSAEGDALETVGGIVRALPLLGERPFIVTSGDVFTDFPFASLKTRIDDIAARFPGRIGHLVMVDNPPYHPGGDMAVEKGLASMEGEKLNYAGIGVYHPRIFDVFKSGVKAKLFPWAFEFVRKGQVSAEHYRGRWENIGTAEQLTALDRSLGAAGSR